MATAFTGVDSQFLATILNPLRIVFFGLGQTTFLRLQHCDIGTSGTPETSPFCVKTKQMPALATEDIY